MEVKDRLDNTPGELPAFFILLSIQLLAVLAVGGLTGLLEQFLLKILA